MLVACFPVHGGYSEWAEWAPCSVTCGVGAQKRLRLCNNPLPANGGRHCAGSNTETRRCQGKPCPGESCHCAARNHRTSLQCQLLNLQWTATGRSGLSGRSAHEPVVRATEPGFGPAVTPQRSMEGGHVRGGQWRSSCAVCDRVLVRKYV